VPEIARRLGASEGHLSRTFHRATGLRLVEYMARFRAERAREQLCDSDQPVIDIAFACGFRSLSQFNRVFRAQFGVRPRDARTQARRQTGAGAIASSRESRT
jgi:AraC family transcriptional regulator